ncbi:MAG: DASS family sodium-coupled anion symporter [Acidobacteria bacterium]|nr:DASS family sodium-coupled anion symporter [Acidobacteriota bacterium]MXZ71813.1 DASS family sodium-coupled anion symporter [Acidobacteriota bacterium]MYD72300.1 DASS family sodium-coupled anion symporter [Acidobacteriota bacterium]MYJ04191.1 DASS family sodium-coupled anion symporter [Acidobacteriota bacterium]
MTDKTTARNPDVQATEAAQARFDAARRRVGLILGPALFVLLLLAPLEALTPEGQRLAAVTALVVVFWTTEALPLAVTALLGPVLAVILRVAPVGTVLAPFAHPLIFLFIGSFILAQALFVHRVNERIAYAVLSLRMIGARPTRILIAYGALAAFLSAWMSNTATTAMLVPIGISLVVFMESAGDLPKRYATALMLMTAYGCSIGGMATPVGTPPNIIAIAAIQEQLGVRISFVEWMLFAVPITVVFMAIVFVYLNWAGRTGIREIPGAEKIIAERRAALGPWKPGERNAIIAFGVTVSLWVGPGLLPLVLGREHPFAVAVLGSMPEAVAALTGAILLFLLPISRTERSTLTWKQAAQIDWGTILLFGGGLSLGTLSGATGLAQVVGEGITGLVPSNDVVPITIAATLFTVVLSNTMSNTAAANIAVPIVIAIAVAAGVDPIPPAIAAALGASVAVVLPVSTPPNAIVYASGRIPITKMIQYGLLMGFLAIVLVPIVTLAVLSVVRG